MWSGMSVLMVLLGKGILQGNGLNVHVLDGKRGCAGTRVETDWNVYGRGRGRDYGSCKMLTSFVGLDSLCFPSLSVSIHFFINYRTLGLLTCGRLILYVCS